MNKKLIMTAAALLALTTLAGCNIKPGGGSASKADDSSVDPDTYATVTFDLNYDGAPAAETVQVEKGDYIDPPENPVREGYYFNGWYESADASGLEFDFFLTSIDEDITLYADWSAAYTVTFYLNKPEAAQDEVYDSATVKAGELVTKPANPKISGFEFGGWFKTAACAENDEFNFATPITDNVNLYAKWQEPDWGIIKKVIEKYLSFVSTVYGVEVPKFPNSGYAYDERYSNALVITAPEKCLDEYKPILEAANYTVTEDTDASVVTAVNDYITLEMNEDESRGDETFRMLLKINGAGEATEFNDLVYQIGTQQNFISIPAAAKSQFSKFDAYKGTLQGSGNPCVSVGLYLDAKPEDSTQTDEEYYNSKVTAFMNALGSNYNKGTFSNSPDKYFYDKAYLTMNQVSSFDEATPLRIDLLCYSYCGQYGQGVSINKIDKDVFASACNAAAWKPKASFELDLSDLAATHAVNGKNFVLEYDTGSDDGEDYLTVDILGVKTATASRNAVNNKIIAALDGFEDWETFKDSSNKFQYAYHYTTNASGAKKADAKLSLSYSTAASWRNVTGGQLVEITLTPIDGDWNAKAVADYFKEQALPGDETSLPAYTGDFAAMQYEEDEYGRYLDIVLLYTKQEEALAYKDSLLEAANGYTLVDSDAAKGEYSLLSASGNFQVELSISEDSFEIVIVSFVEKEREFNNETFAEIGAVLQARNGFEFPAAALGLLTATYTKVNYASFFHVKNGVGFTSISLVSNFASGDSNPVQADAEALINYFKEQGYTYTASSGALKYRGKTIYVEATAPSGDASFYALEITVLGSPSEPLDDGHVIKISDTEYIADNGDAFLYNLVTSYIASKYTGMETPAVPSFYNSLEDKSACLGTTLDIMTNLESYTIFYYNFAYEFASSDGLEALVTAYKNILKAAGWQHGEFTALTGSPEGYWNAASGEFVTVGVSGNNVNVRVFFIGSTYRSSVEITPEAQLQNQKHLNVYLSKNRVYIITIYALFMCKSG